MCAFGFVEFALFYVFSFRTAPAIAKRWASLASHRHAPSHPRVHAPPTHQIHFTHPHGQLLVPRASHAVLFSRWAPHMSRWRRVGVRMCKSRLAGCGRPHKTPTTGANFTHTTSNTETKLPTLSTVRKRFYCSHTTSLRHSRPFCTHESHGHNHPTPPHTFFFANQRYGVSRRHHPRLPSRTLSEDGASRPIHRPHLSAASHPIIHTLQHCDTRVPTRAGHRRTSLRRQQLPVSVSEVDGVCG